MIVEIYTDGACRGNPGPGGWGVFLKYGTTEKKLCGFEAETTNNRMELMAAIQAMQALKRPCEVHLYTDSQYVRRGITEWVTQWQKQQWKTAQKKPVKNQDLWKKLLEAMAQHHVSWFWVKGHNDHPGNEMADALANQGIEEGLAS